MIEQEEFSQHCLGLMQNKIKLIDVRAPVEFESGAIPYSINIPILNNEERALVGTTYKNKGPNAAFEVGHQLVSGEVKQTRVTTWLKIIEQNPQTVITCFRGGLRSKLTQEWLQEAGQIKPRVKGGYKALRQFLIQEMNDFSTKSSLLVLTGNTGSAKTKLLRQASCPLLDLEKAANHRGSAFGGYKTPQPTQTNFENLLCFQMLKLKHQPEYSVTKPVVIEDESRLIGRCVQPDSLFLNLRNSPVVVIAEPLEQRVLNTYEEYILQTDLGLFSQTKDLAAALKIFDQLNKSLQGISNRLGGLRFSEIKADLDHCRQQFLDHQELVGHQIWISKLLDWYYDPLYSKSFEQRNPKVLFKGNYQEVLEYLTTG